MNLNHLFYFNFLAKTENYTQAAHQLRISQPSLSYAMKKLEEELNVPLFEKKGRNIYLTDYGKELYQTTDVALNLINRTVDSIQKQHQNYNEFLKIGIVSTLASVFLPELLSKESQMEKNAQKYQMYHGYTSDILQKIEQGVYDVGLCSKKDYPNLTFIPIKKQPFVLIVNPMLYHRYPNIRDCWFEKPLVTYRESLPIGSSARAVIDSYTDSPDIIKDFDDETSIGGFVTVNPSVAIVAQTSLLRQFDLPTFQLDEEEFYHTVYLAYLTENREEQKIMDFRRLVEKYGDFRKEQPNS